MRLLIAFVFAVLLAQGARAADAFFYVAGSSGIYRDSLDTETGKLGALTLAVAAKYPNFLALSPDGKSLYATLDAGVGSFAVQADGGLSSLGNGLVGVSGFCHVSVDGTGKYAFAANYDRGCIAYYGINPDGSLREQAALIPFAGSGPDPKRQTKPYAHSVYPDPENKFVYACDLGTDRVWIFKFDATKGTLTPNDPPFALVPPGSGPRHLAFGPGGKFVYVASEMGHSVTVFSREATTGALTALETVPTLLPETPVAGVTTAEIVCHPSGKWLYVSNRGCDTMAVFAIGADGKLTLVQSVSSVARMPRGFAIDPSGKWLVVAGQKDNRIVVLKIDPETGKLSATDQVAEMVSPVCVLFQK